LKALVQPAITSYLLFVSPTCLETLARVFFCETLPDGSILLTSSYDVDCTTTAHRLVQSYAVCAILIYGAFFPYILMRLLKGSKSVLRQDKPAARPEDGGDNEEWAVYQVTLRLVATLQASELSLADWFPRPPDRSRTRRGQVPIRNSGDAHSVMRPVSSRILLSALSSTIHAGKVPTPIGQGVNSRKALTEVVRRAAMLSTPELEGDDVSLWRWKLSLSTWRGALFDQHNAASVPRIPPAARSYRAASQSIPIDTVSFEGFLRALWLPTRTNPRAIGLELLHQPYHPAHLDVSWCELLFFCRRCLFGLLLAVYESGWVVVAALFLILLSMVFGLVLAERLRMVPTGILIASIIFETALFMLCMGDIVASSQ